MKVDIEYLLSVGLLLTGYHAMFQSEELLILCTCDALKTVVLTILGHFLKLDLLKCIFMADMCMIDLKKEGNYLSQESIDITVKPKKGISKKVIQFFFRLLKSHIILRTLEEAFVVRDVFFIDILHNFDLVVFIYKLFMFRIYNMLRKNSIEFNWCYCLFFFSAFRSYLFSVTWNTTL